MVNNNDRLIIKIMNNATELHIMQHSSEKSLVKALNILMLFLDSKEELSISEICQSLNLHKSTVSRITSTMVEFGFLKQKENRGKFSLGTVLLSFGGLIKSRILLRRVAIPYLIRLSQRVKEVIVIAYGDGRENVFTETYHDISISYNESSVGNDELTGMQLHFNSLGKIMLSNMSNEELINYFHNHDLIKYTPHTIVNLEEMQKHLVKVRETGIALDNEEYQLGMKGVGAGIRDVEKKLIGSISVVAPSVRMSQSRILELIPEVKSCADAISRAMGFKG
jgi:IclR family transcriptional regulator, KDG regulon repressor